jgi:hypothetical protein
MIELTERIILDLYIKSFLIDIILFNHEKTPQITYLA